MVAPRLQVRRVHVHGDSRRPLLLADYCGPLCFCRHGPVAAKPRCAQCPCCIWLFRQIEHLPFESELLLCLHTLTFWDFRVLISEHGTWPCHCCLLCELGHSLTVHFSVWLCGLIFQGRRGLQEHWDPSFLQRSDRTPLLLCPFFLGWRIGKGEGYADLEYAMMVSMGAVHQGTPVVTIVHDCQVRATDVSSVPLPAAPGATCSSPAMRGADCCPAAGHLSTCSVPAGPRCNLTCQLFTLSRLLTSLRLFWRTTTSLLTTSSPPPGSLLQAVHAQSQQGSCGPRWVITMSDTAYCSGPRSVPTPVHCPL